MSDSIYTILDFDQHNAEAKQLFDRARSVADRDIKTMNEISFDSPDELSISYIKMILRYGGSLKSIGAYLKKCDEIEALKSAQRLSDFGVDNINEVALAHLFDARL